MKVTRKAEETPLFPPAVKGNNQEGCKSGIEEEGKAGRRKGKKNSREGKGKGRAGQAGKKAGQGLDKGCLYPVEA
jgi:hypothetical protein